MRRGINQSLIFQVLIASLGFGATSAYGAGLTLKELDRVQVEITVVVDRQIQFNGPRLSDRVSNNWRLKIDGTSLNSDFFSIVTGRNGTHANPHHAGAFAIGKPHSIRYLGSGDGLWIFEDGKLVWLRVYRQGAFKLVVTFNRGAGGLTCAVGASFPRENGIGTIEFQTEERGRDITVISAKTVASSCRVTNPS
jgi:hypothetical protein